MTVAGSLPAAEAPPSPAGRPPRLPLTPGTPPSLRERKKLATRRLLRRVALMLVAERGLASVTVEDIAEAADVSPRTFFNYFPSKEAVLFGGDQDREAELRDRVITWAPGRPALEALRAVLTADAESMARELSELGGDPAEWLRRMKVARTDPHVRAAHAAQMSLVERAIAEGLAARLGVDQERDPYPGVLAAAAVAVNRATLAFWAGAAGAAPLADLIDQSFSALAAGLPDHPADPGQARGTGNMTETNRKDGH
jgi:AcrR family transcriptional regulator